MLKTTGYVRRIVQSSIATLVISSAISLNAGSTHYVWSHFSGPMAGPGSSDGVGSDVRFWNPSGTAVDALGNVYVADTDNHVIRKITPLGVTTTYAGAAGVRGATDGARLEARFDSPSSVALDSTGALYVADSHNFTLRKIASNGVTSTFAGAPGNYGASDGVGAVAQFLYPQSIAMSSDGNLYVADTQNFTIRKVTPTGETTTFAGFPGSSGYADGVGQAARFAWPQGIATDAEGNVYVADASNQVIRKITPAGVVTTFAGAPGAAGYVNGNATAARFDYPSGVTVDSDGNLFVSETNNATIRKISSAGVVSTLAGGRFNFGSVDGQGATAKFYFPKGLSTGADGTVYVADSFNHTIRKITSSGLTTTLAGSGVIRGSLDGAATVATFSSPKGISVDFDGNVYVADTANNTLRKVTPSGFTSTFAGSPGSSGFANGEGSASRFSTPSAVATDVAGNVYVASTWNNRIRKITPAGVVSTLAGSGVSGSSDGAGSVATFWAPQGIAIAPDGNLYVADTWNHTIRKVSSTGLTTTLAGAPGVSGSSDGEGANASFNKPLGVATDSLGNIYVADTNNHTIRKITPAGSTITLAGTPGLRGFADGLGADARFAYPADLWVDQDGSLFVADSDNHVIRKVTADGRTTTLAGASLQAGFSDGVDPVARFYYPYGIAGDASGNLYIADSGNNAIRKGTLRGTRSDFTGTAGSDLVWQNTETGQRGLWIMEGTTFSAWVDLETVSTAWRIAGTADFNRDGSPDIVWENISTGERGAWLMNDIAFASWLNLGTMPTEWRIAQTGSSESGDKTYILWENTTTGARYCWVYSGTTFTNSVYLGAIPLDWKMVGMGDLNSDFNNDIVWENTTTGERGVWLMDSNLSFAGWQPLGVIPSEWHIAGLADYNADDKLDILWENTTTGERVAWLMNGTSYRSTSHIGSAPIAWKVTN